MLPWTTTITLSRSTAGEDYYDSAVPAPVAAAVPAHIGQPSGSDRSPRGESERIAARLTLPPSPELTARDRITDEQTGEAYEVAWCRQRTGAGLDHQVAGLVATKGPA